MNDNYYVFAVSSLALQMMSVSEDAAQPWVAMGYLCLDTKKATRAVYFAQKVKMKSFAAKCYISIMLVLKKSDFYASQSEMETCIQCWTI